MSLKKLLNSVRRICSSHICTVNDTVCKQTLIFRVKLAQNRRVNLHVVISVLGFCESVLDLVLGFCETTRGDDEFIQY